MKQHSVREQNVWSSLASQWTKFRKNPFPKEVEELPKQWPQGKILDLGCGNGRNLVPFKRSGFDCYGLDFSFAMCLEARRFSRAKIVCASAESLPFKKESFDKVISNASLHHIKKEDLLTALYEIRRVLKPECKAFISVWNKWQKRFIFKPKELFIPWKSKGNTLERYYCLYNFFEFKRKLKNAGFIIEKGKGLFGDNLLFWIRKP